MNADGWKNYDISQPTKYILNTYLNSSVLHTEYHPWCWSRLTYLISSKKQILLLKHLVFRQINWSSCNWISRTQIVRSGIAKWTHGLSPDDKLLSLWQSLAGNWGDDNSQGAHPSSVPLRAGVCRGDTLKTTSHHLQHVLVEQGKNPRVKSKCGRDRTAEMSYPLTVFTNDLW